MTTFQPSVRATPLLRSLLLTAGAVTLLGAAIVWIAYGPDDMTASASDGPGDEAREIAVRVHAWGFSPKVIRVRPGERVRFVALTDDIKHGLAINELDVNLQLVPGREVRSPTVTVSLPEGTYPIHCRAFCGERCRRRPLRARQGRLRRPAVIVGSAVRPGEAPRSLRRARFRFRPVPQPGSLMV